MERAIPRLAAVGSGRRAQRCEMSEADLTVRIEALEARLATLEATEAIRNLKALGCTRA